MIKSENGVTLITIVVMIIIITVIAATSIFTSSQVIKESKEEVIKQNKFIVATAVSKYAAQVATSGVFSPANIDLPGIENPVLEYAHMDNTGVEIKENKNIGEEWYLLLEDELEKMGVTYVDENYLVNYKRNIVIPFSETENIFELVEFYENDN